MKKGVLGLSLVGVVLAGAYTGLWFYNSGQIKQQAEDGIKQISSLFGNEFIGYSSVGTSGFPSSITLDFKDVKLNLMGLAHVHYDKYSVSRGIFRNSIAWKSSGDTVIGFGPFPMASDLGKFEFIFRISDDSYTRLKFQGNEFSNFITGKMSLNPVSGKGGKEIFNAFSSYDSKFPSAEIVDKSTGKPFLKSGPIYMSLTADRITPTSHKVHLKYSVKDLEFTPEMDTFVQDIAKAFQDQQAIPGQVSEKQEIPSALYSFFNLSATGKTTFDLEATYKGLTDLEAAMTTDWNFDLDIPKADNSDKMRISTFHGNFRGFVGKGGQPRAANVNFAGTYKATPELTQFLKTTYKKLAQLELDATAEKGLPLNDEGGLDWMLIVRHSLLMHADRIIPDLDKLGEIKYAADLKVDLEKKSADIQDVSFLTDRGGIIVSGTVDQGRQDHPKADVSITFKNYNEMFGGLLSYALDLLALATEASKGSLNLPVDKSLQSKLPSLLGKFAEKPENGSKDLTFKIKVDGPKVTLGGKDPQELIASLMLLGAAGAIGAQAPGQTPPTGLPGLPGAPLGALPEGGTD